MHTINTKHLYNMCMCMCVYARCLTLYCILSGSRRSRWFVACCVLHPVSITRFPLTRFSPGSGLLRNRFLFIGSG